MQRRLGCLARDRPSRYGARRAFFSVPCEGQALALRGRGCVFFVVRGPVPRDRSLILSILFILAILLQTREILRASRTFSPCCADVL